MKLITPTTNWNFHPLEILKTAAIALAVTFVSCGCSQTPAAPTPVQQQQSFDSQIQSIQNNPNMSAAAKQQAISGIKSQQGAAAKQP